MKRAPYGSWKSPITSDLIASGSVSLSQVCLDQDAVHWVELRPTEGGRCVIVTQNTAGHRTTRTPQPFNARTRVHEYGGGSYLPANGVVYFSNFADQRLYRQHWTEPPQALTPPVSMRYADAILDRGGCRLLCVREDHTGQRTHPVNTIAAISLLAQTSGHVLVSGADFYASPRLSRCGRRLAWLSWNHPNMPWDGTELWVASLNADGRLADKEKVAGGTDESIFQPEWSPDGELYFVSDRTGWWNLYRWRQGSIEPLCPMAAEFGEPLWELGMSTYAFESADRIVCTFNQQGVSILAVLDLKSGLLERFDLPHTDISSLRAAQGKAVFLAGSPGKPTAIVSFDLATRQEAVLQRASELKIDEGYLSSPKLVEFPTGGGKTAYGFYYPPRNKDFKADAGERPPLLVKSHGGPTSAASTRFNLGVQFWTSRGIAVLDVNYGGSSRYGRDYRGRLDGQWGLVDVEDCVRGAAYLVGQGLADGNRLAIDGGSAGGYTTLCALTFRDTFKAGASYFGVSDLEALVRDTHKFESRYLDRLVAPYPKRRDIYLERSPIHHTDRLSCPVILLQGLEDKIVPPNQAELMFEALQKKGLPVAYVPFEGEQHGFRRAENIKRALDAELYFYSRVFGFETADRIDPVPIENL